MDPKQHFSFDRMLKLAQRMVAVCTAYGPAGAPEHQVARVLAFERLERIQASSKLSQTQRRYASLYVIEIALDGVQVSRTVRVPGGIHLRTLADKAAATKLH